MRALAVAMITLGGLIGTYTWGFDNGQKVNAHAPTCWVERNPLMSSDGEKLCGDAQLAHTERFVKWVTPW